MKINMKLQERCYLRKSACAELPCSHPTGKQNRSVCVCVWVCVWHAYQCLFVCLPCVCVCQRYHSAVCARNQYMSMWGECCRRLQALCVSLNLWKVLTAYCDCESVGCLVATFWWVGCFIFLYFFLNKYFIPQLFVLSFGNVGPNAFSTRNTHLHNNTSFL